MKAVLLTGHGGPEKLEYREDVRAPEPVAGEVLIQVGAAGINNTDIWTREGAYGAEDDPDKVQGWRREPLKFPRIQGADIAGRIITVGDGVSEGRIDERVVVDNALYDGDDEKGLLTCGIVGSERDGGYAEYVTVPAENAHAVESELSDAELATFPTSYITSFRILNRARIAQGETILVTGASGGVGTGLVQLAKLRGAFVIAQVGAGKEEQARAIGADAVVSRSATDLATEVREATDERSIDVVADVVGGPAFVQLLSVLRPMGRYVTAGGIAGALVQLDLRTLYLKQLELIGSTMGTHEEFAELVVHISAGELKPLLAKTYPLSQVRQAHEDFKAKGFFGKLALLPTE